MTIGKVAPLAGPDAVALLMPTVIQIQKKQLSINGMNPEVIPEEIAEIIKLRKQLTKLQTELAE